MSFTIHTAEILGDEKGPRWGLSKVFDETIILLEIAPLTPDEPLSSPEGLFAEILSKFRDHPIKSLSSLQKFLSSFQSQPEIVTLIVASVFDNVLYLGLRGEGQVFIKREGKVVSLLEQEGSLSGFVKDQDILFVISKSFRDNISAKTTLEILQKNSYPTLAENFIDLILEKEDSSGSVGLASQFTEEKVVLEKIPPKIHDYTSNLEPKRSFSLKGKFNFLSQLSNIFKEEETSHQNEQEQKSKRTLLTIALILTFLLFASIFLGLNNTSDKQKLSEFTKNIDLVSHQFDEAVSLIDLNPARARSLLKDSQITLENLEKKFATGTKEYKEIKSWLEKIKSQEGSASKVYQLGDVPTYYDIKLLKVDGTGATFAIYKNNIAILDTKNKVIYKLEAETKQGDIIAGKSAVKDASAITLHGSNVYFLSQEGITTLDLSNKNSKAIIKKDDAWGNLAGLVAFAGNIYLLDKTHNEIWKYISTSDGFTARGSYLNSDVSPDFSDAKSLSIDGSVWVLSSNDILKFTQGRPDQFTLQGLVDNIAEASQIFTNDDTKFIYLLDKGKGRIIVFEKDGTYQSAYAWSGLKSATSFLVSEELKKIFVLSGSKIYGIDLR
ncbi:hypothetical protein HY407_03125 [Candidatus Gottesmanbacteria bacterium]|nr:hypothetical protein [Candidatus Gottesmanbacteria bacterium]